MYYHKSTTENAVRAGVLGLAGHDPEPPMHDILSHFGFIHMSVAMTMSGKGDSSSDAVDGVSSRGVNPSVGMCRIPRFMPR
jgi:hypothetical protein